MFDPIKTRTFIEYPASCEPITVTGEVAQDDDGFAHATLRITVETNSIHLDWFGSHEVHPDALRELAVAAMMISGQLSNFSYSCHALADELVTQRANARAARYTDTEDDGAL